MTSIVHCIDGETPNLIATKFYSCQNLLIYSIQGREIYVKGTRSSIESDAQGNFSNFVAFISAKNTNAKQYVETYTKDKFTGHCRICCEDHTSVTHNFYPSDRYLWMKTADEISRSRPLSAMLSPAPLPLFVYSNLLQNVSRPFIIPTHLTWHTSQAS